MTHWDDIERLVHDRIDGLTSAADEAKLAAILASDPELARRACELTDVVTGLRSLDREQAPADFTRRVMDRVASARGASARGWTWRMAGPALMAAAAIVVTALWIGRGDRMPPTLEASAPAGSRDVWSESAAAPASKAKSMPGATIESKREEAPGRFDDDTATLGFVGRPQDESAEPDPVLDALTTALRDHARVLELDDAAKDDLDESESDAAPPAPAAPARNVDRPQARDDGENESEAVRVILLRPAAIERKQKPLGQSRAGAAKVSVLDGLLPPTSIPGGLGGKAKSGESKNRTESARSAASDALRTLASTHAARLRDVELDDAALAAFLRAANEKGYDAFELDPASIEAAAPSAVDAPREKDAADGKDQSKAAETSVERDVVRGVGALRWLPIPSPTDAAADAREVGTEAVMKKAVRERPRRRTIVVLAAE